MRFLGVGDYHSLGDMYLQLGAHGHEVRVHVGEAEAHGIFRGLNTRVDDWRAHLEWIREAGEDGIVLFETASMGATADALRNDGFHVIGGSAWGDRIEQDRAFGQAVMREAGMSTAPTHAFVDYDEGVRFIESRRSRYVYKLADGIAASTRNYVGELADGSDVIAVLQMERSVRGASDGASFVLMEHLDGIEVGIGAFFNGREFLEPCCIDWEHKRFFPGDLGELTGEMGTVVSYRGGEALFARTLALLAPALRRANHCGYLNINTIVNEAGVWPLEFTSRFGYPGFAICDALHVEGWAGLFRRMVRRDALHFPTRAGFAVGVVLTVPPFPYEYGYAELSKGMPIFLGAGLSEADRGHLHFGEVEMAGQGLITSGSLGYIMVVTGCGDDIAHAQQSAYARVRQVVIPNVRYRRDIGDSLRDGGLERLRALGLFPAAPAR